MKNIKQSRAIRYLLMVLVVAVGLCFWSFVKAAKVEEPSTTQKAMMLNKPGVVFITTYYTGEIVVQSSAGYPELSGKSFKFETGATGSGFVVNPEGYILTNGHVVKFTDDQLISAALMSIQDEVINSVLTVEFQKAYGMAPTKEQLKAMYPTMLQQLGGREGFFNTLYKGYKGGEVKMDNIERNVYVQSGIFTSGKKIAIQNGYKADVKVADFDGWTDKGEVKGKDIGIIKVSEQNLPTVKLGDSGTVQVGDKINIIGYPGVATFAEFLSQESSMEASVTSGIISAEKTMKDGSEVLQTDASITYGNSGGPAFLDKNGEVIGIASMVATETSAATGESRQVSGFSYLRPSNVAKEFLKENGVENKQGPVDEAYKKALNLYWERKYSKAIKEFEKIKRLYPAHPGADELIKKSQEGIARGEEVKDIWPTVLIILGAVVLVVIIAVLLMIVLKKRKKSSQPQAQQTPPAQSQKTTIKK